jgi:hypothetical protein
MIRSWQLYLAVGAVLSLSLAHICNFAAVRLAVAYDRVVHGTTRGAGVADLAAHDGWWSEGCLLC